LRRSTTGPKPQPVDSFENLRARVDRFFRARSTRRSPEAKRAFELWAPEPAQRFIEYPNANATAFVNFLADALPQGDVFLFGGILRDLALLGRRGFNSDIDLVVQGDWSHCVRYLESVGARRNRFGGFRMQVGNWPIDVWNAEETWAIREGLVSFRGIASLTETTILNWDAILMDWRTRRFIYRERYLEELTARTLDVVLTENPNPLGMAARVFRHLCAKDAKQVTVNAAEYLINATATFGFEEIRNEELRSYGSSMIDLGLYRLFEKVGQTEGTKVGARFKVASEALRKELQLF
jgi:hypothetical protein